MPPEAWLMVTLAVQAMLTLLAVPPLLMLVVPPALTRAVEPMLLLMMERPTRHWLPLAARAVRPVAPHQAAAPAKKAAAPAQVDVRRSPLRAPR